jgi:hypothetical protein
MPSLYTPAVLILKLYYDLKKQARGFYNLASRYGHFQTIRQWSCLDASGKPVPWYTYPAIEYLSHLDLSPFNVFEYGSGNSTRWWAPRCASLTSVEDDAKWYGKIRPALTGNVNYVLEPDAQKYVALFSSADIVIIDGSHREECANRFLESPTAAMLIFDNADWFPAAVERLRGLGWPQVDLHGFGPINEYTWTTSVFINPARAGEIRYRRALRSVCGIDR